MKRAVALFAVLAVAAGCSGFKKPRFLTEIRAVDAAGNNNAAAMLLRDAGNITTYFAQFAPALASTQFGKEIWGLYERGALHEDSPLTGVVAAESRAADVAGVLREISDVEAEHEARLRYKAALEAPG